MFQNYFKTIAAFGILSIGFLPMISSADIEYSRTPAGQDITAPVTFSVKADKFSDFGFKDEDKINSWNFVIYDDHGNVYLAGCAPKTSLTLKAESPLGFGGTFNIVALGAHYDANCESDTDISNKFLESNPKDDIIFNVNDKIFVQDLPSTTRVTSFSSGNMYFLNIGKMPKLYDSCRVDMNVSTGVIYASWAEAGIFKSMIDTEGNRTFSKIEAQDVSKDFSTTGEKSIDISLKSAEVGDDLWIGVGSQAATPFQLKGIKGETKNIVFQSVTEGIANNMPGSFIAPSAVLHCE
jgi:hypothetical protein